MATISEVEPVHAKRTSLQAEIRAKHWTAVLLVCGILAPLLYVAMNIVGAIQFKGYSSISQTVSELSAIGAPSRSLWVRLGIAYAVLLSAFGLGVWLSARGKLALRVVGGLLVAGGLVSLAWPPMHLRGEAPSLSDTLHILFTVVFSLFVLVAIGFGATALGRRFRLYSIATILTMLAFGALASLDGPRIAQDLPTPLVGVWERINIAALMFWLVVLAFALLRHQSLRGVDAVAYPMRK